ncbi:hypothetical protein TGVAND_232630 [Toxoplasma gondii VAND]|uniref:Uncharacterized protein n=2 Tax=Toxoplasma gondii TaxID=5811 RepID=A0A086QXF5_TOXGO|nr:hypothetical protein TGVAND_232630 [Toxoplasma gondii VAND]KFH17287.1 hypothetical protein TGMAS_232630 [Toxoplasma gondii MAS]
MNTWISNATCSQEMPPVLYSDGHHTYVCVQGPNGPEYIQRRQESTPLFTPTSGFCDGFAVPSGHLGAGAAGNLTPQSTSCSTSSMSDFAPSLGSDSVDGADHAAAVAQCNPGKRRLDGNGTACSGSRDCHSEEHDTCERALKHSRSFGLTHVMSFSSVSYALINANLQAHLTLTVETSILSSCLHWLYIVLNPLVTLCHRSIPNPLTADVCTYLRFSLVHG